MNIWLIVTLLIALGLVVGNILLLKMSDKMTFEKTEAKPEDEVHPSHSNEKERSSTVRENTNKP